MSLFLGIDLGTSYFKVALFDQAGALKGLGRVAVEKTSPGVGRSELSPDLFWHYLRRALGEALSRANAQPDQIAGLSYSSQASTFLLLGRYDEPVSPLIFWNDTRGESVAADFQEFSCSEEFRKRIGYAGVGAQTAACKWVWFQRNEPQTWKRVHRIMTLADYFTFVLTGERSGDAGTAAFLGIYDLKQQGWWPEALRVFGVDSKQWSTPLRPGSSCAATSAKASEVLGIPAGIPFAVGSLDHHVGALGAGLGAFADVSITTGTVLAALALVASVEPQMGQFYGLHTDGQRYYHLAFDPAGAGQLEDYQRRSAPHHSVADLLTLAGQVRTGAGNSPYGQPVLEILETIGFTQRRLVREVSGGGPIRRIVATGGGARSPLWLQVQADILNAPVTHSASAEPGCLGAAVFAARAAGAYPTIEAALAAMVHPGETFEPLPKHVARYRG